ncbi:DUF4166 domain-containing protein [Stenotrophomonas sp. NPDC077464]|uniref:DUF4166 domain-containing protein n=1 Tax=unclassified Stenotrophomonas TaxID=196198 RepID=UPI0037D0A731
MEVRCEQVGTSLYQQLLNDAFDALPAQVQALHRPTAPQRWAGVAEVRRGRGVLARLVAALFGFPKAGVNVPVSVTFTAERGGERWTRDFAGRRFSSWQRRGSGRDDCLLVERFGPIDVSLALLQQGDRLLLVPRRWAVLGIRLPNALLPQGSTFETEVDGHFVFHVEIAAPLVGLIVAYRGTLLPSMQEKEALPPLE